MTAFTHLAEENESVAELTAKTATADVGTAVAPPSTTGMLAPFTNRTRKATAPSMLMLHRWVVPSEEIKCPLLLVHPGKYRILGDDGNRNHHTPRLYRSSAH